MNNHTNASPFQGSGYGFGNDRAWAPQLRAGCKADRIDTVILQRDCSIANGCGLW
jgi:hypothetical protein